MSRFRQQLSIEPDVLIMDESFRFPALRSGRYTRPCELPATAGWLDFRVGIQMMRLML
jgi:hypothetical protein